eukprot:5134097-Amphidinium_carterae.4
MLVLSQTGKEKERGRWKRKRCQRKEPKAKARKRRRMAKMRPQTDGVLVKSRQSAAMVTEQEQAAAGDSAGQGDTLAGAF